MGIRVRKLGIVLLLVRLRVMRMEVESIHAFKGFERMGIATSGNWQRGDCVSQDRLCSRLYAVVTTSKSQCVNTHLFFVSDI